jgi:hypothetical protein
MLAADLQEQVLVLEAVDGAEPMAERTLREVRTRGRSSGRRGEARFPLTPRHVLDAEERRLLKVYDDPARRTHAPGSVLRDHSNRLVWRGTISHQPTWIPRNPMRFGEIP